jgi:hypothetical protein
VDGEEQGDGTEDKGRALPLAAGLTALVDLYPPFYFGLFVFESKGTKPRGAKSRGKSKGKALLFALGLVPLVGGFLLFFPFLFV